MKKKLNKQQIFGYSLKKPKFSTTMLASFVAFFVIAGIYIIYRMYAASTFDLMDGSISVSTIKGVDRISATGNIPISAIGFSKQLFPTSGIPAVVVSTSVPAEMPQGSLLASTLKSPFLITAPTEITPETVAEIKRLAPQKIYLVGTSTGITGGVEAAIINALPADQYQRVGGSNNYALAANIGQLLIKLNDPTGSNPNGILADGTIMITSNASSTMYDVSYSAGSKKYPVLYAGVTAPLETRNFITSFRPTRTIVVGNTTMIPDSVAATFPGVVRIAGADRYDIAYNLLTFTRNTLKTIDYTQLGVAPVRNNYIVMLASPYMAKQGRGILVNDVEPVEKVRFQISNLGKNYGLSKIYVFGDDLLAASNGLLKYANAIGSNYTTEQISTQKILDARIRKCPLLTGALADSGDTRGYQAISYYSTGKILISPAHTATVTTILNHEIYHIYDWRDNGYINWGERIPPVTPDCTP